MSCHSFVSVSEVRQLVRKLRLVSQNKKKGVGLAWVIWEKIH